MKKNLINIAVATTLGLAAFAASAEDMYRGAWYAVPGVSYMNTDSDLDAKNGPGVFLKLGKELSESWDIQGGLGYNRAKEDTDIVGASGRYKQTTLGLDALYMFSRSNFRPFLLAGLGAARNNIDYTNIPTLTDKSKTSWLANVGLGAQYLINDSFGLQADLRHQWTRSNAKAPTTTFDADGTIGNTLLSLGGVFRFGAPAPAPVVAEAPVAAPEPAPYAAPEPVAEAAPAPVPACKPTENTITVSAEKLFGFNEGKLQKGAKPVLDDAAAQIKANPELTAVIVTGHTDRIGSDAYNQKLSERRANIVKDYLVSQGVDAGLITAEGKGESEPVVQCVGNKTTKKLISCLQPNRRVEIRAVGTKESGCN
ncbi:MAG: OmpA family protein [Methylotenera sp.]|uniref:OmpA family protein n=1 Tax=Methylotenera sp. TaxID=2051956 RepID=UPI0027361E20|nr:outer membrane beta-barrel protein [Methylotenera sp.]MDP1658037.1 OmpA family protein [Methylotenera sp.]MDP3306701.1 OmpA family protein [Methylotenera sp.]